MQPTTEDPGRSDSRTLRSWSSSWTFLHRASDLPPSSSRGTGPDGRRHHRARRRGSRPTPRTRSQPGTAAAVETSSKRQDSCRFRLAASPMPTYPSRSGDRVQGRVAPVVSPRRSRGDMPRPAPGEVGQRFAPGRCRTWRPSRGRHRSRPVPPGGSNRLKGEHIGFDYRVDDAARIAGKQGRRQLAQFLERGRTQRNSILLPVVFRIGQQKLWSKLERLKQAAALSDCAVKQASCKGRGHEDANRYRTGGLTSDGYVLWVAANGGDVPLNPFERGDLVHQAVVSRRMVRGLLR